MVDMSQKKVEIFNESLETSVEDVSMFEPMEEITTEGAEAIKMEIQEGWILFPTDNCPIRTVITISENQLIRLVTWCQILVF